MFYDLRFPFRVGKEAGLAQDADGQNAEAFIQTTFGNCKAPVSEERYKEIHEEQRLALAKIMEMDPELITCISGEEHEANVDDED